MSVGTFRPHRWLSAGRLLLAAACAAGLVACAQDGKVDRGDAPQQEQPQAQTPEAEATEPPPETSDLQRMGEARPQLDAEIELVPPEGVAARRKVGLLLPLSGPRRPLGQALLEAAQLALFDTAASAFTLVIRDTEGTAEGAAAAARSAIDAGAELILGPVFAGSVEAVAPVASAAAVPVLAFSNDRTVARPGVYVMGLLPSQQVARILGYAVSQGLRRFAVLAPDNAYGDVVVNAMETAAPDLGGEVARVAYYEPGASDVAAPVKRLADFQARRAALKQRIARLEARGDDEAEQELRELRGLDALGSAPFDAVLLPAGGNELRTLAPNLPFYDIDPDEVRFLGTALWDDPSLGTEPALAGGWFAAPPPSSWNDFRKRYRRAFGAVPPRLASIGYDATALAALLARRAGDRNAAGAPVYTREALTIRGGFAGVDGVFRLREDGLVERRYAVIELRRNAFEVLDPAPTTFRPLTN